MLRHLFVGAEDGLYNESVLEGFVDEADEAVYAEAVRLFRAQMESVGGGSRGELQCS